MYKKSWWWTGLVSISFLLVASAHLAAQSSLEVSARRASRLIPPGGYTTFIVDAVNKSDKLVQVQVIRILNEQPDENWSISVCSPELCYDESVDTLLPYTLVPGEPGGAQVHMQAGDSGSGKVLLSLDPQDGSEPVLVELRGEVGELPQQTFVTRVDSTESSGLPGDTVEFGLFTFNISADTMQMRVHRLETDFPDASWGTSLCRFASCVDPEIDSLIVPLLPNQATVFVVRVVTGEISGTSGSVEVEIDPQDGSEPEYHRLEVLVDQVGAVGRAHDDAPESLAFPNPATSELTIRAPGVYDRNLPTVEILNSAGKRVYQGTVAAASVDAGQVLVTLRLSPETFPNGHYFYRIRTSAGMATGSFEVIR